MGDILFDLFLNPIFNIFTNNKEFTIFKNLKGKIKVVSAEESYPLTMLATIILMFVPINGLHYIPVLLLLLYYTLFQKLFLMLIYSILTLSFTTFSLIIFENFSSKYIEWVSDTIFYYIPGSNPTVLGIIIIFSLIIISAVVPFYIFNKLQLWHIGKLINNGFEVVYTCSATNVDEALIHYASEQIKN
jgi:hypothetical protein